MNSSSSSKYVQYVDYRTTAASCGTQENTALSYNVSAVMRNVATVVKVLPVTPVLIEGNEKEPNRLPHKT